MPELPDVLLYIEVLRPRIVGQQLERIRLASPFVLRSVTPPISSINGRVVKGLRRLGKQIVFEFEGDYFLIIHLMIAGRFQWKSRGAPIPARLGLASFDFPSGSLLLTEAGTKKRASLYLVQGESALASFDRGALEVLNSSIDGLQRGPNPREPHGEAFAYRSTSLQRNRQCIFGRNFASCAPVPAEADIQTHRRRNHATT